MAKTQAELPAHETILYATRKGNESWQEEIITTDEKRIPAARAWAEANGFDRIRVARIDLRVPPNFGSCVRRGI
jgi:hypothetical protein